MRRGLVSYACANKACHNGIRSKMHPGRCRICGGQMLMRVPKKNGKVDQRGNRRDPTEHVVHVQGRTREVRLKKTWVI